MAVKYPTRCQIVDADGGTFAGLATRTPAKSRPHIGKEGLAELLAPTTVRITLDDGTVIWGYECWWVPLPGTSERRAGEAGG